MKVPQAAKKYGLLPPEYNHIGTASCTSTGINSEQVPDTVFMIKQILADFEGASETRHQSAY